MKSIDMYILYDSIIVYRALFNGAVVRLVQSNTENKNVKILELYAEITKSKKLTIQDVIHIDIFGYFLIILAQSSPGMSKMIKLLEFCWSQSKALKK